MRGVPLLLALMFVGACASPAQQSGSSSASERPVPKSPVFRKAPTGVVKLRERLRLSDPGMDGYAQRYPSRFDAGSWHMHKQLNRQVKRLKAKQQFNAAGLSGIYRQVLRRSWLIRDLRAATGRAVLQMNAAQTRALMQNLLEGLKQTADTNPRQCVRIAIGIPGLLRGVPATNRNVYRQQIRSAILNRQRAREQRVSTEQLQAAMINTNRVVGKQYPDRLSWSINDSGLSSEEQRRRCALRIEHLAHINKLPKPQRLGMQRVLLSSLAEQASITRWKTYLSYNKETQTLLISGPMAADLPDKVLKVLRKHSDTKRVVLDSPGGLQHIGMKLARIIRVHNLDTHVTHICLSACTMAFLGGNQRTIGTHATLGYHDSIQSGVSTSALTSNLNVYRRYYPGLPDAFLSKIRETPNASMWAPDESDLLQANVITAPSQREQPIDVLEVLNSEKRPADPALLADLQVNAAFWETQNRRLAGMKQNGSANRTIANYVRDDHHANLRAYQVNIPDALVEQALSLRTRVLSKLEKAPGTCLRAFSGEPLLAALRLNANKLYDQQLALNVRLIRDSGPLQAARWDPLQAKDATRTLLRFLLKRKDLTKAARQWIVQNLGNPIEPVSDDRACHALKTILQKIATANPAKRGLLFRALHKSTLRWVGKDRYGQALPWADRVVFDSRP